MTTALACALALLAGRASAASLLDDLQSRQGEVAAAVQTVAARSLLGVGEPEAAPAGTTPRLAPALRVLHTMAVTPLDLDAIEDALDDWHDPRADRLRAHVEASDPARRATGLMRDERHDRWAAAVNDTLRPFGLGTNLLAVVNPVLLAGSAVDSVLTAAAHVRNRDRPSVREHEALAAFGTAASEAPHGLVGRDAAREARSLDRRVRRNMCRRLQTVARDYVHADRLLSARYLLSSPDSAPCDDELRDLRSDVADALERQALERERARWPVTEPRLPRSDGEWQAFDRIARAAALGDSSEMLLATERLRAGWPDGPNERGSRLVAATARRLGGHREAARDELHDLTDDDDSVGAAADDLLATLPDADASAMDDAETRHARAVARYVLMGSGPSTRGVVRTAAYTGAQGAAGLSTLGITNAIGVLTRGFIAWRRDPASNDAVIADGERYLARAPDGPDAVRIRRRLVRAYKRSKRWDRALLHYQALPDAEPDEIRDLEGKIADDMLKRAANDPRDPTLLRAVVLQYPASSAAERAREILAARDSGSGIPVPKDVLADVPWLLGASGLGLPPGLLDGSTENGELDDAGIRVTSRAIECSLRGSDGDVVTETISLAERDRARVFATLSEIGRVHRQRHPEDDAEIGRWERWIPFFIEGTVGDAGVAVRPGVKLRPYEPAHPDRYR